MVRLAIGAIVATWALHASISSRAAQETAPAPAGRPVDLGGRRLPQHCTDSGSPAVVIENGAAAFSIDWVLVQAEVAKFTAACTYDRAGYACSDRGPSQNTIEETIDDLHLLLARTSVQRPYVMVGALAALSSAGRLVTVEVPAT